MKVLYFAWLRERIGKPEEEVSFPPEVSTVRDAIDHLSAKGEEYAYAFENPSIIRAALDRAHVPAETPLADARELAFFPPMTGG
jgi:molybdopterin synthase sulfur carrier subunit